LGGFEKQSINHDFPGNEEIKLSTTNCPAKITMIFAK
jgi:hypothetical protein